MRQRKTHHNNGVFGGTWGDSCWGKQVFTVCSMMCWVVVNKPETMAWCGKKIEDTLHSDAL